MGAIVVGYVPKPEGHAALEHAAREAVRRGATVVVVSSVRGDQAPESVADLTTALDAACAAAGDPGLPREVRELTTGGDAADDLVRVAEEVAAELIVIGLRRRTPVGKLILGSNAQRILLDASCPVLAVKA